jgi:thymidylate kinase
MAGFESGIMVEKIHGLNGSLMLAILKTFFIQLKQQQIRYCLFKSNQHLGPALAGETDIDMLILPEQQNELKDILKQLRFIKMKSPKEKSYSYMADYIGFDEQTGNLIHLHLHWRLIFGSKYLKNYIFPDETYYLANSIIDSDTQLMIARPDLEIRLLCLRIFSKISVGFITKKFVSKKAVLASAWRNELDYLIENLDENLLNQEYPSLSNSLSKLIHRFIVYYRKNQLTLLHLLQFKFCFMWHLRPLRIISGAFVLLNRFSNRYGYWRKKPLGELKKYIACPAVRIAFLGVDGAGKTTAIPPIKKWLKWKLRVKTYYLGKPRPKSLLFFLLNKTIAFLQKTIKNKQYWLDVLYAGRLVLMARQRVRLYRESLKMSAQGFIILYDRFPLPLLYGMNNPMDGPKIKTRFPHSGSGLLAYLAKKETDCYLKIDLPHYFLVLKIDLQTALRRKSENNLQKEQIAEKISMIDYFLANHPLACVLDATLPVEQVLLQLKQKIWEFLQICGNESETN